MKKVTPPSPTFIRLFFPLASFSLIGLLASGPATLNAQTVWQSVNQNWADTANWNNGVPDVNANNANHFQIGDITGGNFPIIETNNYFFGAVTSNLFAPSTIGTGTSSTARLDIRSGSLSRDTSSGNIGNFTIAANGAGPVVNVANTAVTGQSNLTTYGQGSGSLNVRELVVGGFSGANSTLNINTTGSVHATVNILVGGGGGATGTVNLSSGSLNTNNFGGGLVIGNTAGASGFFNMEGGTIGDGTDTNQRFIRIGRNGTGTLNQTGGSITLGSAFDSAIEIGENAGSTGTYNMSGGTATMQRITVGLAGTGTLNVSGTADLTANANGTLTIVGTRASITATGDGTVNLNGGRITANQIRTQADDNQTDTSTFNFNGGVLRAGGNSATFMQGLTAAHILSGGAIIDSNGFNVTIAQDLMGVGGLIKRGGGTLTLSGANSFNGDIAVESGTLSIASAFINSMATVSLEAGAVLDLNFIGDNVIGALIVDGTNLGVGTFTSSESFLTGSGTLTVVPEPSTYGVLGGLLAFGLVVIRRRRS